MGNDGLRTGKVSGDGEEVTSRNRVPESAGLGTGRGGKQRARPRLLDSVTCRW